MDLDEIELFSTLMRTGTATETARVLGISQPGVSARLKRMEARLGLLLFQRTGKRLWPTAEADALFAEASAVFEGQRRMDERVAALRRAGTSAVGISATPAIVGGFLAAALSQAGYSDWTQELSISVTEPEIDVMQGLSHLGLQLAFPARADFVAERLLSVPLVAVMPASHLLAGREELCVIDFKDEPLVCYDPEWSPMGGAIRKAWHRAGLAYAPRCVVPFCSTVCQLITTCGGIGFVDAFTARGCWPDLAFRRVNDLPDVALVMFHARDRPLLSRARQVADALRAAARASDMGKRDG